MKRLAALVLALACVCALAGCNKGSDVPLSPGLSMVEGVPIYDDDVAMKTDNVTLTPGMMAYFFYAYGGTMLAEMELVKPYDKTKTLHEQMYTETQSFYDVIMNATLVQVTRMMIYCEAARAEGIVTDDKTRLSVELSVADYRDQAAVNYGLSLDEYLKALYGPLMDETALRAVLELEAIANSYSLSLESVLEESIEMSAIRDYAAQKGLTDTTPTRNISFVFVPYQNGKPNEEKASAAHNAVLASPTAATVTGLVSLGTVSREENLSPANSGITAITEWLFDEARAVGDVGRVETESATYILLYTGNGMSYAELEARMALFDIAYADWYNAWVERLTFGYNYDCLDSYDIEK